MHLVEKLVLSPWFWLDVVLSVTGGLLVWWGLQIEKKAEKLIPPSDFKPDIFGDILEQQKWELERGWRILMRGIALEVVAAFGISIISGLEIADFTDKAASAIERTALVESNNLVLRSNVVALEIKLQPRTITPKQIENFIFLTEKIDKNPHKYLRWTSRSRDRNLCLSNKVYV